MATPLTLKEGWALRNFPWFLMWKHAIDRVMVLYKYMSMKGLMLAVGLNVLIMCLFWKFALLQFLENIPWTHGKFFSRLHLWESKQSFLIQLWKWSNISALIRWMVDVNICLRTMSLSRVEGSEVKLHTF
jgi:hypothetical protein